MKSKKTKNIAVFPGSFNPVHPGHLTTIYQATKIFDKVIVLVAYEIHWLAHMTKDQVKNWAMKMEGIEYAYEYRTNIQTGQTWVFRKYKVSEMTDLEIKRCLNSMKIATERMPKDKAITKLKTVIDLYEGKFKW